MEAGPKEGKAENKARASWLAWPVALTLSLGLMNHCFEFMM